MLVRIDIVGREMQVAGFLVDHPAWHRDSLSQDLVGNSELFKRVNTARRKREINGSPADNVALAWISAALVKIDMIPAPTQIRGQKTPGQTTTDEDKLSWHQKELNRGSALRQGSDAIDHAGRRDEFEVRHPTWLRDWHPDC
jgi:hypothetical protein